MKREDSYRSQDSNRVQFLEIFYYMSIREEDTIENLIKITTKDMKENMSITDRILKRDIRILQILGNKKEE